MLCNIDTDNLIFICLDCFTSPLNKINQLVTADYMELTGSSAVKIRWPPMQY